MKGMDRLVALRMRGKAPAVVIVEVTAHPRPMDDETVAVIAHPDDDLSDLRPLVGLPVLVAGWENPEAVLRFCRAATASKTASVTGFYGDAIRAGRMEPDELVYAS